MLLHATRASNIINQLCCGSMVGFYCCRRLTDHRCVRNVLLSSLVAVKNTNSVHETWMCHLAGVRFQFSWKETEKIFNSVNLVFI